MVRKTLLGMILLLGMGVTAVDAGELKQDMDKLASDIYEMQVGFFTNDKAATLTAVDKLKGHVKQYLGDKYTITQLLPDELKYKSSIAVNSATLIEKYANEIENVLNNRDMRMINKQMRTQKAFLGIQNQCFRCHNLVRDWQ